MIQQGKNDYRQKEACPECHSLKELEKFVELWNFMAMAVIITA